MKAATLHVAPLLTVQGFQSTPPVKAATALIQLRHAGSTISIHAAREGGDQIACEDGSVMNISIHAAREGGDIIKNEI